MLESADCSIWFDMWKNSTMTFLRKQNTICQNPHKHSPRPQPQPQPHPHTHRLHTFWQFQKAQLFRQHQPWTTTRWCQCVLPNKALCELSFVQSTKRITIFTRHWRRNTIKTMLMFSFDLAFWVPTSGLGLWSSNSWEVEIVEALRTNASGSSSCHNVDNDVS